MKNTRPQNRLHGFFLAFLIVVLAFAAVGFGTLGSVTPVGKAYELRAERTDDEGDETPGVAFRLTNPMEGDKALPMRVCAVYINIAAIYAEAGTGVTLKLQRSSSGTYYYDVGNKVTVENFTSQAGTAQDVVDPFFNYVAPFDFSSVTWKVDTYHIAKLFLDGKDGANVLLNEVVFVGEVLDEDEEGTGKYRVIPATIESATPYATESAEEAKARAAALLDAQYMPSDAQSTFFRYTRDEAYTLMTIAEMGRGSVYAADRNGVPIDTYTAEGVYGVFGTDIVALGTLIFGMSPFGARFFSMLAAVLTLVLLSRLLVRLTKSEKAGLVFAVLYAASCLTLGYGHMATPLMVGIFFFALSLWLTYGFYEAKGLRRASVVSVLPLLFAGLAGGAAICVQGAFVIPMLGVVGLFIAGMVRQNREKSRLLAEIIEEAETGTESASGEEEPESPGLRAGRFLSEYRFKNTAAPVFFAAGHAARLLRLSESIRQSRGGGSDRKYLLPRVADLCKRLCGAKCLRGGKCPLRLPRRLPRHGRGLRHDRDRLPSRRPPRGGRRDRPLRLPSLLPHHEEGEVGGRKGGAPPQHHPACGICPLHHHGIRGKERRCLLPARRSLLVPPRRRPLRRDVRGQGGDGREGAQYRRDRAHRARLCGARCLYLLHSSARSLLPSGGALPRMTEITHEEESS